MVVDFEISTYSRRKRKQEAVNDECKIENDGKLIETQSHSPLFSSEELSGIDVLKMGDDFIEVDCGCTNHKYGDAAGKLRIYGYGKLEIYCDCYPGCDGEKISPSEFEKHAGLKGTSNWRSHVWVFVRNGEYSDKVSLKNTKLLKYYRGSASDPSASVKPLKGRTVHRDEVMTCTACGKKRRFTQRNKEECKIYHQATKTAQTWICCHHPNKNLTCEDDDERETKLCFRGCPLKPVCEGCTSCICCGCQICRFDDCSCLSCIEFTRYSEPQIFD